MNAEYEKNVGKKIRELRLTRELTQEQLAAQLQVKDCDVTRSALAKIEAGQRHLYVDELKALAEIFRVSADELLSEKNL